MAITEDIVSQITDKLEYPNDHQSSSQEFVAEEIIDNRVVKLTATFVFEISDPIQESVSVEEDFNSYLESFSNKDAAKVLALTANSGLEWDLSSTHETHRLEGITKLKTLHRISEEKILRDLELFKESLKTIEQNRNLTFREAIFGLSGIRENNLPIQEKDEAESKVKLQNDNNIIHPDLLDLYCSAIRNIALSQLDENHYISNISYDDRFDVSSFNLDKSVKKVV